MILYSDTVFIPVCKLLFLYCYILNMQERERETFRIKYPVTGSIHGKVRKSEGVVYMHKSVSSIISNTVYIIIPYAHSQIPLGISFLIPEGERR